MKKNNGPNYLVTYRNWNIFILSVLVPVPVVEKNIHQFCSSSGTYKKNVMIPVWFKTLN